MRASGNLPEVQARQQQPPLESAPILAPQRAVQDYLNTLLQDATTLALEEDGRAVQTSVESVSAALASESVAETAAQSGAESVGSAIIDSAEPPVVPMAAEWSAVAAAETWLDGRPHWAQQRFECLLFKVAGLMLAVPLVELGGVLVVEQELRPLFGQPDWFLGLLPSKTTGTVKAIDTARWVMPEKYTADAGSGLKYVILMAGSDWGMACHSVEDAITLEPHQVSWRGDRSRRPWLAGTVVDHMCAIMDVAALRELLQQSQAGSAEQN